MVLPYVKITPGMNVAPKMSNQTPIGPNNPWPIAYQVPQRIKTWLPHTTPNIDNYQGIAQHMKTRIPTNLPPGVNPGSYGFIIECPQPKGIKTVGNVGRINPPAGYSITPGNIKTVGYQGIPQHIKIPIQQIVPEGVYPDTYGTKKMSYDTTGGFIIGGIVGFALGIVLFTATGRNLASSAGQRAAQYIGPKS